MFLYLTYQFRLLPNNPNSSFFWVKIFPDHFTNILIREMFLLVPLCSYFLLWKFLLLRNILLRNKNILNLNAKILPKK